MGRRDCKQIKLPYRILIPLLMSLPFLLTGFQKNYSELAEAKDPVFYLCLVPVLLYAFVFTYRISCDERNTRTFFFFYAVLFLLTLIVPYHTSEDLSSSVHLLAAYSSFAVFQLIIFSRALRKPGILRFYTAGLFTSFMICMSTGTINAPAELVCGIVISIVLDMLARSDAKRRNA